MNLQPVKSFPGKSTRVPGWSIGIIGLFLLIFGIWIGSFIGDDTGKKQKEIPVVFTPETMAVAKQFGCSCGSCGEKSLAACVCPTATSTKKFIEMNLNGGMSMDQVVGMVKDVYGHYTG